MADQNTYREIITLKNQLRKNKDTMEKAIKLLMDLTNDVPYLIKELNSEISTNKIMIDSKSSHKSRRKSRHKSRNPHKSTRKKGQSTRKKEKSRFTEVSVNSDSSPELTSKDWRDDEIKFEMLENNPQFS